jgi:hypothetical protein
MSLTDVRLGQPIIFWDKKSQTFFFLVPQFILTYVKGWGFGVNFQRNQYHFGEMEITDETLQYCYTNRDRLFDGIFSMRPGMEKTAEFWK